MTEDLISDADRLTPAALGWAARVADGTVDWDAFTDWLEADERHQACYDAVAVLEADLADGRAELATTLPEEWRDEAAPPARRWWIGVAAAAALAVVAVPTVLWRTRDAPVEFATRAGQITTVALSGGGRATLAPSSRLTLDGDRVTLAGAAWFDIPAGADRGLEVRTGSWRIAHIGTRFEVKTVAGGGVWVAVATGRVALSRVAGTTAVRLNGGERALTLGDTIETGTIADDAIGSWRTGQLVYEAAPLAMVASDLSRYVGQKVAVDPSLAATRFTGSIAARGGDGSVRDLAALTGAQVIERPSGLTLAAGRP